MNCFLLHPFLPADLSSFSPSFWCVPRRSAGCDFHTQYLHFPVKLSQRVDFLRSKGQCLLTVTSCFPNKLLDSHDFRFDRGSRPVQFVEGVNLFVVQSEAHCFLLPHACFMAYAAGLEQPDSWVLLLSRPHGSSANMPFWPLFRIAFQFHLPVYGLIFSSAFSSV